MHSEDEEDEGITLVGAGIDTPSYISIVSTSSPSPSMRTRHSKTGVDSEDDHNNNLSRKGGFSSKGKQLTPVASTTSTSSMQRSSFLSSDFDQEVGATDRRFTETGSSAKRSRKALENYQLAHSQEEVEEDDEEDELNPIHDLADRMFGER